MAADHVQGGANHIFTKKKQGARELRREPFPGITVLRMLVSNGGYRIIGVIALLIVIGGVLPNALTLSLGLLVSRVEAGAPLTVPLVLVGGAFLLSSIHGPIMNVIGEVSGARARLHA